MRAVSSHGYQALFDALHLVNASPVVQEHKLFAKCTLLRSTCSIPDAVPADIAVSTLAMIPIAIAAFPLPEDAGKRFLAPTPCTPHAVLCHGQRTIRAYDALVVVHEVR